MARNRLLAAAVIGTCLAGPAAAAADVGAQPFDGFFSLNKPEMMDLEGGGWVALYDARGALEDGGGEAILSGMEFRCVGMITGRDEAVQDERGLCRFRDARGNVVLARLVEVEGRWLLNHVRMEIISGTGPYARVRGEGWLMRSMLQPRTQANSFGVLAGYMSWRLE